MQGGGSSVAMMVAPIIILLVVVAAMQSAEAETYKVGNTSGWTKPGDPSFYSTWASEIVFNVNDVLEFNFNPLAHDVAVVSKEDYDSCTKNTTNLLTTSPATVTLPSTGSYYFLCTFDGHCASGQKLAVTVPTSSSNSPPGTPTPPTPTTGTPTPYPPPPPSRPPPPPTPTTGTASSLSAAATTSVVFGLVYAVGLLH